MSKNNCIYCFSEKEKERSEQSFPDPIVCIRLVKKWVEKQLTLS